MKKTGWIAATAFLIITLVGVGSAQDKDTKDKDKPSTDTSAAPGTSGQIMGGTFRVINSQGHVVAMVFSDLSGKFERWVFINGWNIDHGTAISFMKVSGDQNDDKFDELTDRLNNLKTSGSVATQGNKHLWTRYPNDYEHD